MKKVVTLILALSFSLLLMIGMANGQTHLWGTCWHGGGHGYGTIFKTDSNGNNLQSDYSMFETLGAFPIGDLVYVNNGKFYGIADSNSCAYSGVIYSYESATGIFDVIYDFGCSGLHGMSPFCGMTFASDGKLYGLCSYGGAYGYGGVIYSLDPVTNVYTDIFDFDTLSGFYPGGTLTQLSNGKLYGITQFGGANNGGTMFSFDPANSTYTLLHSFADSSTGLSQYAGNGGLLQATDGKLYGMNYEGGPHNAGFIFSYDLSTNVYNEVFDFDSLNGGSPFGNLIQASNGLIYGMTEVGGNSSDGVIFSYDITTNTYTDLFDFDGTNGETPTRGLMQARNGLLYGTTDVGGNLYWGGSSLVLILILILKLFYIILVQE